MKKFLFLTLSFIFCQSLFAQTTIISTGSSWKYLDDGSNQGTAWYGSSFNDSSWAVGNAQLGYGDGDEATVVGYGGNSSQKYITTYFRKTFSISNLAALSNIILKVKRDDGIVVYINGTQRYRNNMPSAFTYTTLAPAKASDGGSVWLSASMSKSYFASGNNVVAVEIHQQAANSSDISFDLNITATSDTIAPTLSSISPADNSSNVSRSSNLTMTFNENIQKGTGNIIIKEGGTTTQTIPVSSSDVNVSGTILTIDPANFTYSSSVNIELASGVIKDIAGNSYAGISSSTDWNFTVEVAPDTLAPTLSSVSPTDNSSNVGKSTNLTMTFNENIQKGTGNIIIKEGGTTTQTIPVSSSDVSISGTTLTIDPANFTYSSLVNIELVSGVIKDIAGNNYAGISSSSAWDFTIEVAPDTIAPNLSSVSPNDNSSNVSKSTNLTMTFNENIQKGTGNIIIKEGGTTTQTIPVSSSDVSISGAVLTIDPANFTYSSSVNIELASGVIKDIAGNNYAGISSSTDWDFTIEVAPDTIAPTLSSVSPTDNSSNVSRTTNLTMTFNENIQKGTGNIIIKEGGTTTQTIPVSSSDVSISGTTLTIDPANFTYSSSVNIELASGVIKDIAGNNYAGISSSTDWDFTIEVAPDTIAPTLSGVTPADNSTNVSRSSNLTMTFNENIQKGTGNIIIKEGGTTTQTIPVSSSDVSISGTTLTIDPANFTYSSSVNIEMGSGVIKDIAGNNHAGISSSNDWDFTIEVAPDTIAPTLSSVSPTDNSSNVSRTTNLTMTFNENIQKGTGNIIIKEGGTTTQTIPVNSSDVSISGTILTIDPANFTYSSLVNIELASGVIKDIAGNSYAGISSSTAWDFTIEVAPDTIAPTLSSISPTDNSSNVSRTTNLTMTFNESIQKGTGNIIIKEGGTTTQTIPVSSSDVSISGTTLTIDPANFTYSSSVNIELASGVIKDLAGNSYAGISSSTDWNFTIEVAPDTIAPTLSSVSPTDNSSNVSRTANLTMTFNENIQKGTGNIIIKEGGTTTQTIPVSSSDVSISGTTLTIDPANFTYSSSVNIEMASGVIKDIAGNSYAGISSSTAWDFTIEAAVLQSQIIIYNAESWKYLDNGSDQGTAWRASSFNDGSWATGNAELGYGDGDEATVVSYGSSSTAKHVTTYFRKAITISNPSQFSSFTLNIKRDDGVVVYINGTERYRNNMPGGTIIYTTLASSGAANDGNSWSSTTLSTSMFTNGTNVIAVEIHQDSRASSDLSFDLELLANVSLLRGPYLQMGTPNSIILRWRTLAAGNSIVKYGLTANSLDSSVTDNNSVTNHIIQLNNLIPNTQYYYSIGSTTQTLQGDQNNYFVTAPVVGTNKKTRVWVTGDCGYNSTNQRNVKNKYYNYIGSNLTDVWLLLGDNAYNSGLDNEYQSGFYNIYQDKILKQAVLWPAPGNHDYNNNSTLQNSHNIPYYDMFSLPNSGQAGGVSSGTEAYYSFNYANIHFISLDSYGKESNTYRLYDTLGPQAVWIKQDLAADTQKWKVVYWHHPPYSMGTNNSDNDGEMTLVRQNFIKILERYKVDLVLCGHSHVYERSRLMKGHFGKEATFNSSTHNLSSSSARYDGSSNSCPYHKNQTGSYNGTVYVVSGSSGQLGHEQQAAYPHNAMFFSNNTNGGSVALTIEGNRLDSKWICADGSIRDSFTMVKDVNKTVNITINSGQSADLTASWIGKYSWSAGSQTSRSITVSPTNDSSFQVTDGLNCLSDVFNITVNKMNKWKGATQKTTSEKVNGRFEMKVYPNPFTGHTTIEYSTPGVGEVTLEIYDMRGYKIRTLVSQTLDNGTYKYVLKTHDENLTGGIYILKLNSGESQIIQKISVLE